MKELFFTSDSSNTTMNVSHQLAKYLSKGDTVVLTGELGARKN